MAESAPPIEDEPTGRTEPRPPTDASFLGHPRGLRSLFGLELWERFSYLGMQAILVLYFADTVLNGGLGLAPSTAASLTAAYGTLVYLVSVAGGWLADRVLGSYRSVLWGGILIAAGHYTMAVPTGAATWAGLALIIAGTGLLKPNVSTMVGKLYATDDERRDAGFAIYYTGINIGAFLGPLVTGFLGQKIGYHWGFSAAAIGMTLGLVQYVLGRRHLAGRREGAEYPLPAHALRRALWTIGGCAGAVAVAAAVAGALGALTLDRVVDLVSLASVVAPVVYFAVMFRSPRVTRPERARLRPYVVLFAASVVFNMILFQAYSVLTLLASDHARTDVFGWDFPSTWYGSVLGVVEVVGGPLIAALWVALGRRQPHASAKIATGVILGGLSFLVLVPATAGRTGEWEMAAWWLIASFALLGIGDVILQTTGMSATTKLAPAAFAGQTMALWFLSLALANGIQAQVVRFYGEVPDPVYFGVTGAVAVVAGIAMIAAGPWLRRTMHPVH
ncbi:peptide MFS transporter [Marinactinospora thermotolerans]|uniref:Proton-dependent oligopeptide transporter, POT family n=1 Tax=Marinactinospora thermotolerans DSM 45154 TaxID=1122192 RepID=A0A1T4RBN7_9ACTN|nr:peptide MFS transporter [Marinactinospora thermotolerans]SKA13460.1 proton-dependent oligopeptide transporter, POT family [Marinactinospora thermotolerans DSM 45154]